MTVYFIGAGPGAADLITVRGQRLLRRCPVCLYAGSIMPEDLLALCPADARVVDTGPLTLDQIVEELAAADAAGHDVARLHSGDPSLYSAVAEQCRRLDARGIDYEIVPGVPAFAAAAAVLRRELTVPGVAQTVTLSRVATLSTAMPPGEDLTTLSAPGATLVLHLAAAQIDTVVPQLLDGGYRPETPCAVVAFVSWPQQQVLHGTLGDIAGQMHAAGITRTAVIVVGDVLTVDGFADSYLYSPARGRTGRKPTVAEKGGKAAEAARAKEKRVSRYDRPPSWRGAFIRACVASVALLVLAIIHHGVHLYGAVGLVLVVSSLVVFSLLPVNVAGLLLLIAAFVLFVLDLKLHLHGAPVAAGIIVFIFGGLYLYNGSVPNARVSRPLIFTLAFLFAVLFFLAVRAALKAHHAPLHTGKPVLGARGVVLRDLAPVGVVRVNSEEWSAKLAEDAPIPVTAGTRVRVVGTTGLTLEVVPAETDGEADGAEPGTEVNR